MEKTAFTITTDQADRRLDRLIRARYSRVSLGAIMKAIRKGAVRVNGRRATGDVRLACGDVVIVPWADDEREGGKALPHPHAFEKLAILYRDDDILCVDKPAGLLSQPDRQGGDSLVTRIWGELSWMQDDFRPALISRLDRNVSGVVAAALNASCLRLLSELMRERRIGKTYLAVVGGVPPPTGEVDLPLSKDNACNRVFVDHENGLPALTRYRLLERGRDVSLVELELVTGRPHQARIHLSTIGFPILGDAKYGGKEPRPGLGRRIYLHAYTLAFPNDSALPPGARGTVITAPPSSLFAKCLR